MSAGHFEHRHDALPAGLRSYLTPQLLAKAEKLVKKAKVVEGYDSPYLIGRSTNFARLYPDRHLPRSLKAKGKSFDPVKTTAIHEAVEWLLMKEDGLKYQDAHRVATRAERNYVEDLGLDWKSYSAELDNYIKGAEHAKIRRVPSDFDLGPFEDEHDRAHLKALKAKMGKTNGSERPTD